MSTLEEVAALLRAHDRVLVACHEGADGDAIGSLLGLGRPLRDAGWDVVLWAPGAAALAEDYAWLGYDDVVREPPADADDRLLVAVDCGSAERLGERGPGIVATAVASANVDHHADNTRFADVDVVDARSPCATILVARLLRLLDLPITPAVATSLYVGIVTDTGRFMYANATPEAHTEAAHLIAAGAVPEDVFRRLYEGKPAARVRLLARALATLELRCDDRLAVAHITVRDLDDTGAAEADSEGIIDHLRAIAGVEVAAMIREPRANDGVLKCSLRSARPGVDVQRIARAGGGGGHTMAAGFAHAGDLSSAIALIESAMVDG